MGNHMTSCVSPAASNRLHPASHSRIKLLNCSTGTLSELEGHLTAAEAMMEFPAQFLCSFSSAAASASHGRRICAVPADEELLAAELYLPLPMQRLNSRFSVEEMTAFAKLEVARKSNGKKASKGAAISQNKVAPVPAPTFDALNSSMNEGALLRRAQSFKRMEGMSDLQEARLGGAARHGTCRSKSWMPKLETVNEYAVVS